MAEKPKTHKVGESLEVKDGIRVQRPDGSEHTVRGSSYVLDVPGTFVVDGTAIQVK